MKRSHDDRLRDLVARDAIPAVTEITPTKSEGVSDPVQLSRAMLNRATRSGLVTIALEKHRGFTSRHAILPAGRVAAFLRTSRRLQRLPSFTNRRE